MAPQTVVLDAAAWRAKDWAHRMHEAVVELGPEDVAALQAAVAAFEASGADLSTIQVSGLTYRVHERAVQDAVGVAAAAAVCHLSAIQVSGLGQCNSHPAISHACTHLALPCAHPAT